jgi:hypothetical protein
VFVTDADNREVLEYDGASGVIQRWYAYGLGPNDVLNQMNVTSGTRAALVPDILGSIIGSQDSSSGALTKVGYLPYGKSASACRSFASGRRTCNCDLWSQYDFQHGSAGGRDNGNCNQYVPLHSTRRDLLPLRLCEPSRKFCRRATAGWFCYGYRKPDRGRSQIRPFSASCHSSRRRLYSHSINGHTCKRQSSYAASVWSTRRFG